MSKFALRLAIATAAFAACALPASAQTSRTFQLQTAFLEAQDMCLEGNSPGAQSVLGGGAFQDTCSDVTGQAWTAERSGQGYFTLKTQQHGGARCLEGNRTSAEAELSGAAFMDQCKDVTGQRWKAVDAGNGYYQLQTEQHGGTLCLEGNSRGPNSVLQGAAFMNACSQELGQRWKFAGATVTNGMPVTRPTLPLAMGTELVRGQRYWSRSGDHFLVLNPDGNLVVAKADGGYVWGFDTQNVDYRRVGRVVWQEDGNLAAYAADGGFIWSALSANPARNSRLVLKRDGALQIVSNGQVRWSSATR